MHYSSDNSGPIHPKVMEALHEANQGWAMPYGNEDWTRRAADKVRNVFEAPDAAVYFVATGTAANALLLGTLAQPFQTIFCTAEAHIHVDECNAPEFYSGGAKLTLIESRDALMDPDALGRQIEALIKGGVHSPQPGPVSITTASERGTLYSLDHLRAITDLAHRHGCPVHLDGARFANAMVALGVTPAEMTWKAGIDAVSFGGTKNGLMAVEAAVIFDPQKAREFELRRKRGGHLFSKGRFLAAQIDAYLSDNLWISMAEQANAAGQKLARDLSQIPEVSFLWKPQANMLFPEFPRAAHRRLQDAGAMYYLWDGEIEGDPNERLPARLVCDWSSTVEDAKRFVDLVRG